MFIRHAHFASLDCHAYARNDKIVGHPHPNGHSFRAFLYTVCATSKTEHEPQGGDQSLKRHCGQGNRPMSFRGVKRRGNPLNRNKNRLTIATNRIRPRAYYRTENFSLSVRARTRTPATVAPNYLLGESWEGHPHPIHYC